jgi:hypothetical protein
MKPPLDPDLHRSSALDPDEQHLVTYLRMLDVNTDGADWREVSRIVLHIDAELEPDRRGARSIVISLGRNG